LSNCHVVIFTWVRDNSECDRHAHNETLGKFPRNPVPGMYADNMTGYDLQNCKHAVCYDCQHIIKV